MSRPKTALPLLLAVLLTASTAAAKPAPPADPAAWFKRVLIKPIYEDPTRCRPLGGHSFYVPVRGADGRFDPSNEVVVLTEAIRRLVTDWYQMLFAAGNMGKDPWGVFEGICVGLYEDVKVLPDGKRVPDPNAFASDQRHIMVGVRMLDLVARGAFGGDKSTALVYLLAHEFGHHIQYQWGLKYTYPTKRVRELQADCLAGYIIGGSEKTSRPAFFHSVAEQASHIGDDDIFNPQHHGTGAERRQAVRDGYVLGLAGRVTDLVEAKGTTPRFSARGALNACAAYPSDEQRAGRLP